MSENLNLEDLLAQAQEKLRADGEKEEKERTQVVTENLEKREQAIEVEERSANESEEISAGVVKAKEKYEFAQREIAEIDAKADILRAAGMETQLQGLYDLKNAELATRQQELQDAEAQLATSQSKLENARTEGDKIVPPTMAETATPEQKAAREALEKQGYSEDTIRTADANYDEAIEEEQKRNQEKRLLIVEKINELSFKIGSEIEQSNEFLYLRRRFPDNIDDVMPVIRSKLEGAINELDFKNKLPKKDGFYKELVGIGKVLERNGFFQRPDVIEMFKLNTEYWEITKGKRWVENWRKQIIEKTAETEGNE